MAGQEETRFRRKRAVIRGGGIVSSVLNRAIDILPVEFHLPGGYNYCGPGTKLAKRLARGDRGINPLDEACKIHDIAYARSGDSESQRAADKELASKAWSRVKASDSSFGERAAALAVAGAMKAKTAIGGGSRCRRTTKKKKKTGRKGRGLYLRPYPKSGEGGKKRKVQGSGRVKKRRQAKKKKR